MERRQWREGVCSHLPGLQAITDPSITLSLPVQPISAAHHCLEEEREGGREGGREEGEGGKTMVGENT